MVATRRGTRVAPQDEGSAAEQTPEKVISPTSPVQTRRSLRKDVQASDNSTDEGKSVVTSKSPVKSSTQITTRSRHRSGQSGADISEAESTASNSSTRRTRSRPSLGEVTDSTRKLRSLRSAVITEPIIESKENAELSEAESNCSSVSTRARKKQPGTASRLASTRSQRSGFVPQPTSDVSDAESTSCPVSGTRTMAIRSTRSSSGRHLSQKEDTSQAEQTSDAESCSSGVSLQPLARRSSRRKKSQLHSDEVELIGKMSKDDTQGQEILKMQIPKIDGEKSEALSSAGEEKVLPSPRRSFRNKPAIPKDEVIVIDDDEPESSVINKALDVEPLEVDETSSAKEVDLPLETSAMSSLQSSETQPEENLPDQLQLSDNLMEEEPALEKSQVSNDKDATEESNGDLQGVQEGANVSSSMKLHLFLDSDHSEKSEHDDDDDHKEEENNIDDEEEDHEQVVERQKSIKALKQPLQSKRGDSPRVDSNKKYLLESEDESENENIPGPSDDNNDHKEEENNIDEEEEDHEQVVERQISKKALKQPLQSKGGDSPGVDSNKKYLLESEDESENENIPGPSDDDDDDDFIDDEFENNMEEENYEQVVEKRKSKKASTQQLHDALGDGLFVIDTAPGVDPGKKYFLEPKGGEKEDKEVGEKGEMSSPEDDEDDDDDDDFIDKDEDEDEEETLLNRPKSGLTLSTSIDTGISLKEMGGLYINFDAEKPNPGPSLLNKMKKESKKKDELLQKSVITPDYEKKESVPPYMESQRKLKKSRKEERDKTTGRGWFDMKAPELTEELKNDLKALKMRSAMDPKHFYKKNDRDGFPKYFEVATVVDDPRDFYHSRVPKNQRKRTIVEELLSDSEFRRYNKKKFKEIIVEKAARAEGKKNRKKKKFRT
ncbi:deoxynucleotidyltransferase terminal-interacting protein 2 [Bufo gargarizans]|uniref:deoxynucleotidyltransferase terminal-interacting protein 2 n=1 Tax=Bufo gargarizans TaxID=30331 RepID=UPI001CF4DEA0|nr:deoxynucleotidyltransferase terminal-interacting protein 2 [Bufo gargarizans]